MGQRQSGPGGGAGDKKDDKDKKKKYEPPVPTRVGKKKKRAKGPDSANKLPSVTPHTRCRLRQLKLERIKVGQIDIQDFLLPSVFQQFSCKHVTNDVFCLVRMNIY